MDHQLEFTRSLIFRSAGELALVTALVFATGWGGVHLAQAFHQRPVGPGRGGVIELRLAKSDRQGDAVFQEGAGYAGWWRCQTNWAVEWRLAPKTPGKYRVELRVASVPPTTNGHLEVTIGDQVFTTAVPDTGGPTKWTTLEIGTALLEAKPYTLNVRPGAGEPVNLNLKSAALRPAEPAAGR